MMSQGKVYEYKHSITGEVIIEFRRLGSVDEVKTPSKDTWEEISPSILKANKSSKKVLNALFPDGDELAKFFSAYAGLNDKASAKVAAPKVVVSSDELFPLVTKYTKEGEPVFDNKQILLHTVEKLARSDARNTIANSQYFIRYEPDGVHTYELESVEFRELLINSMLQAAVEYGTAEKVHFMPTASLVREMLPAVVECLSRSCIVDRSATLDIRTSSRENVVYYDTLEQQIYKITAEEVALVDMPKGFLRLKQMAPLGDVDLSANTSDFRLIEKYLPYSPFQKLLYMTWMVAMAMDRMYPGVETIVPIVLVAGPQGSTKTSATESSLKVIDPVTSSRARTLKYDDKMELAINLSKEKFAIWDNLSGKLDKGVSDMLCTAVTGGSIQKRKLYTDALTVELRPIGRPIMTTMHLAPFAPDLAERTINLVAIKPSKPTSMVTVNRYLTQNGPRIRGAYIKLIQKVLAKHEARMDEVVAQDIQSRLNEFCAIGDIIAEEFGLEAGDFTAAFKEMAIDQQKDKADTDGIAQQVLSYIHNSYISEGQRNLDMYNMVKSAQAWAEDMRIVVNGEQLAARGVVNYMGMVATSLETLGIKWEKLPRTNAGSKYKLTYTKPVEQNLGAIDSLEKKLSSN